MELLFLENVNIRCCLKRVAAIEAPLDEVIEHPGVIAARMDEDCALPVVHVLTDARVGWAKKFVEYLWIHLGTGLEGKVILSKHHPDPRIHHGADGFKREFLESLYELANERRIFSHVQCETLDAHGQIWPAIQFHAGIPEQADPATVLSDQFLEHLVGPTRNYIRVREVWPRVVISLRLDLWLTVKIRCIALLVHHDLVVSAPIILDRMIIHESGEVRAIHRQGAVEAHLDRGIEWREHDFFHYSLHYRPA